jgi:CHASE2 domain-containing sensor protein
MAAFAVLLLLAGQSIGMLMWDNPVDAQKKTVVQMMKAISTPFMGSTKSLADYYKGNNWLIFGLHALVIFILWVSSTQIESPQKKLAVTIVSAIALIYLIFSVVYFVYFFPLPIILSLLTSIFLGLAIKKSR